MSTHSARSFTPAVTHDASAGETEWSVHTVWTTGLETTTTIGGNSTNNSHSNGNSNINSHSHSHNHSKSNSDDGSDSADKTDAASVRRLHSDEPLVLGGSDNAPNPGEYLLTAPGQCHDEAVRISPVANTLRGQAPVHVQMEGCASS
ncbi:hypothetical protein P43SY_011054 [Pythium insidiosum]|uniref:Uncharacterized protein n=1 Tax=Pythium insidiosum TaxID=114742 RepID=A0AAD5Q0H7_PYTIN|nr:hypothetical protein P43SY_011054 [Pythium insidiosum]